MIEYSERLLNGLAQIQEYQLLPAHLAAFTKFITHCVWSTPDRIDVSIKNPKSHSGLWLRMQNRINEMKDRRKRLVKLRQNS